VFSHIFIGIGGFDRALTFIMDRLRIGIVLVLSCAAFACSAPPRTIKPYDKDGIRFSHFSDWFVTDDSPIEGTPSGRSIVLKGPNEALVTFICLPTSSQLTLEMFAASVAKRRAKLVEDNLSVGPIRPASASEGTSAAKRGRVSAQEREGIMQHFSIKLLGVEIPHEATFYAVSNTRYKVMIMTQVASQSAKDANPGFDLALDSFSMRNAD
jgi:hypothetical protein